MSNYLLTLTKHYAKNPEALNEGLDLARSMQQEYEETRSLKEDQAKQLAQFKAEVDAENAKRTAELQPRLIMRKGKDGKFEAIEESKEQYASFLSAQRKKADAELQSFGFVDTVMSAFDKDKADKIEAARKRRDSIDSRLAPLLAGQGKVPERSFTEAATDQLKSVTGTVYDIVGSASDFLGKEVTGLERRTDDGKIIPGKGTGSTTLRAVEGIDTALGLAIKGRDLLADLGGFNPKVYGDLIRDTLPIEDVKRLSEDKLAEFKNLQVQENQRRAKAGLPSIEQENNANLFNRYANYAREEADKARAEVSLARKVKDAQFGQAAQKGLMAAIEQGIDDPTYVVEKAIESSPFLLAGGPASRALKAVGASEAAAATGGTIAIGALDTAQGAQQAKAAVNAADMAELAKSDAFQKLKAANPDATPAQLREVLAMAAENKALGVGLPLTALLAGVSTKLGLNPVETAVSGGAKKFTALGAAGSVLKEAAGEFPEEAGNQWSQNVGEIAGGVRAPDKEMEGVLGAGAMGAMAGGATSAGVSTGQAAAIGAERLGDIRAISRMEDAAAAKATADVRAKRQSETADKPQSAPTSAPAEESDAAPELMPVSFFENSVDRAVEAQISAIPETEGDMRAFADKAKAEYKEYVENGTPMSADTAEFVKTVMPEYKAAVAPKSSEEIDAGLKQLVSDVFALSQDTGGQSLGTVNSRVMQRISGETSYQVLEKFAELQAIKAANAGTTRAGQVFSAEAEAANTRARQLKNQYQMPTIPAVQQQAPEATVTAAPEVAETPSGQTSTLSQWDMENRTRRSDEWFEGAANSAQVLNSLPESIANRESHGMAKAATATEALRNLVNIFQNGLDPNRGGGRLYTAPLGRTNSSAASASATGTASGSAYRDGPFILVGNEQASQNGIRGPSDIEAVLVNPALAASLEEIRAALPNNVKVGLYTDANELLSTPAAKPTVETAGTVAPGARVNQIRKELQSLKAQPEQTAEIGQKIAALEAERDAIYSSRGFAAPKAQPQEQVVDADEFRGAWRPEEEVDLLAKHNEFMSRLSAASDPDSELQSATKAGETKQVGPESTSRRKFIMGFAAAAATAAATGAAPSGTFADDVTLGEAKALTKKVMSQKVSATAETILRGNGGTNQDGASRIKGALREIVANGPIEVRELAKKILSLMPSTGISLEVDDSSPVNAHGAVELLPAQVNARGIVELQSSPKLTLFTLDGREGLSLDTFLHESLHVAVVSRYVSLGVGSIRDNDSKLGASTPKAAKAIDEFVALWEEFKDTLTFKQKNDTSEENISIQQAANSPDEFFVRSLTDPDFQKYLAGVEYKGKTLFDKFKDWVKTNLFGFKKGTAPSWLDAALVASNNLSDAMAKDAPDFSRVDAVRRHEGYLQSAASATDGSVTSPKPTAKKFKDMSLFEQWAIVTQLRDTTSAAEFDSILAGIASGGIMLRNDPTTSAEASITRVGKKIVINLAQFTGKNLKQRRADAKKLRKQANAALTLKDRLSRKAKKEKLQAFYMTNFTALVQSSTSFVDALRHEVTHAKDMMSNVDMEAVNEMMANNPLWAASAAFVEANPATANMSRNDKLLETNGYYMTALSAMASNPQYAPLLATFEESVYAPMKELTAFMTSEELLKHWASVLDNNSKTSTLQSATGRTLTLPQANRNQRLKALLEQKITSTELPKGPLKAEAVVDTSPGKPDRVKSVGLQLGMLLDARDAVEGKTKSEAVAALRALRDSEDVVEPHEANILAGIAEDNYASRLIMDATLGMTTEAKLEYTMLLTDLFSDRDISLSTIMSLPVYTTEPTDANLQPLWAKANALRGRLLGAVGGAASVAEMGEAYRSDIKVSDQENNSPAIERVSIGSVISGIKDGALLNGTDESLVTATKSIVAAARAKVAQYETITIVRSQKHASAKISTLAKAINGNLRKLKTIEAAIQKLIPLETKLDKFLAGLKKEPKQLSGAFGKLNKLTTLREEKQRILDDIKKQKADLAVFKKIEDTLNSIAPGTKITAELADVMIQAHKSAKLSEQKATYEFKNAVVLEDAGQTAIDDGEGAINSFLNSVHIMVSNQKQGVEGARVFVSPEEAATDKKLVEVDGKYYDLLKVVDSMVEVDGLKYNKLKPQVYIRYLYDSLLAISIANKNAAVLPTYVSALGRQLHALVVEYTEVETDSGIVEKEKIRAPKQFTRNDDVTGKPYKDYKFSIYGHVVDPNTSDITTDPALLQMYKNAVEGSVAQARFSSPSGTTVFSLAEEKGTDLKSLDDVLDAEVVELTTLRNNIESILNRAQDKDYEKEYEAYFPTEEDGKGLSEKEEEAAEEKRKTSWWWLAGTEILLIPEISEILDISESNYRGLRNDEGTASAATFEATWSVLDSLQEQLSEIESKLEVVSHQNEIVRQMGYDFDSGNMSESYDFDIAANGPADTQGVGNPRMGEYKYKYDPADGVWKKTEDIIAVEGKESEEDAKTRRAKRLASAAKAARVKAVASLVRPTIDESGRESRIAGLTATLKLGSVLKRELLEEYLAREEAAMDAGDFSYISNSRYYSKSTPVYRPLGDTRLFPASWSRERVRDRASEIEAWEQGLARQDEMRAAEKEESAKYEDAGVNKYGWKVVRERKFNDDDQGQLFSATGSFSGIFRNIRTRVAADDVNALTAMLADRATVAAIKTGIQNNAFIGPFARLIIKRSTHSAISMFKLRVDGLMAKNTAVIGGKVARLNREMDNLGIPQKERTELLNLLVALDETYTVQAMKAISKTALINKYKKIYGNEIQTVFDMADELRQEVDSAIEKLAKATLGQYTYGTAPKKVKDAYDALLASKQRYLHRTYHKFSISSGRLWKAQIDNAIDSIKKDGPTAVANSSSHSAKAHAAVLNAAYTVVNSWNAFTDRGTPIAHAFKQVAPGWKTMNDAVKLRLVLDMFQEDFMAAAELEITNGSISSISPASKNAGALKAKRLDGPQNKVFRELLGENRDYGRVVSETIENQTVITMHLEMMRQLQHMGLLVDKNTFDNMTVAQRELYTNVPSAGIFSAFSSSYILKDYEYAVTVPVPKESIGKSIRDFNQAAKKGDYKGMALSAGTGTYNAIATTFGLLKMFTVFTSPALWASLFVGMASFSAKAAAHPSKMLKAYQIAAMWKANQAGAPIDPNDPMYDDYMFIMGSETIDSAVFAELTTRAKDSDYEAALAQLDTNGRLIRDMGFKTAENIKDYLIATWTKYEAIPKIAAALAHRDNMNAYNRALGKRDVSPAFVGNIVRREFPSAKDVPAIAKFSDSIGVTMFAGFYYQTIKAGSWGIGQNLNEGVQMYRNAGDNQEAKGQSVKFIARILAGSAAQFATVATLAYLARALFEMDDDDLTEEQRKLKKAAEATFTTTEDPDNMIHIGFHEDGTPIFVDVTMMINPLDVRDALFRRSYDAMSPENKETLGDVLFDQIPYGFVGQSIRNYMRGMDAGKNANKAYDRLTNAGMLRYMNNLDEFGFAPGEAGSIAGALANISGIKKVDPAARLEFLGNQVYFANKDLGDKVTDVIHDGDSYNKRQMQDEIGDDLEYAQLKARVYFDTVNDAFKKSGMSRSEFIKVATANLDEDKAEMAAKDIKAALVSEGEDYAAERAAYAAKEIKDYYNKEVKKGLLATDRKGPLFNASTYEVAAATRNKTSFEAIIDPKTDIKPVKGTVTGVHDADTVYVTTDTGRQVKVRVQNIDAFELKQKLRDGSLNIGQEGQRFLSGLLKDRQVTLFGYGYDDNGRMVARVLTKDGKDAGIIVAEEGYAILTDISDLDEYPTKAEEMDADAPSVYRQRNK